MFSVLLRFTDSDYPFWHLQTLLKYRIAEDCTKLKSLENVIRIVNYIYEAKKQYPSPLHDLFMYLYKNTPCRAIEKVASSFDKTLLFAGDILFIEVNHMTTMSNIKVNKQAQQILPDIN